MATGVLFSGQGSQAVGMGASYFSETEEMQACFSAASAVLGYDLAEICFQGPEERLTATDVCQVALFVVGYGIFQALRARGFLDDLVVCLGLSLGELTSLAAAEALDFEEGVQLVSRRGALMQQACEETKGAMASLITENQRRVAEICQQAGVEVSNYNSPEQLVISGEEEAMKRAKELAAVDQSIRRVIPLRVAGAYHSRLMKSAQNEFEKAIKNVSIRQPKFPVISNVTGEMESDPQTIRELLVRQIVSPVRWAESMKYAAEMLGTTRFLECGPGRVLTSLTRKNLSSCEAIACGEFSVMANLKK